MNIPEIEKRRMMKTLTSYHEEYALRSLEKQEKLARLIGDHTVEVDFETGIVRFSGDLVFPFQVLGTESDNTLTWLWAWADEQSELPEDLLKSSRQIREWGAGEGIRECIAPSVDLVGVDGHVFSMIASAICRASCYYHDPYDGGASFLLLFGDEIDRQPSFDTAALSRQFSHLISLYEINHRAALLSYFKGKELPYSEQGNAVLGELESGEGLRAEFDGPGRLLSINGKTLPFD